MYFRVSKSPPSSSPAAALWSRPAPPPAAEASPLAPPPPPYCWRRPHHSPRAPGLPLPSHSAQRFLGTRGLTGGHLWGPLEFPSAMGVGLAGTITHQRLKKKPLGRRFRRGGFAAAGRGGGGGGAVLGRGLGGVGVGPADGPAAGGHGGRLHHHCDGRPQAAGQPTRGNVLRVVTGGTENWGRGKPKQYRRAVCSNGH